MAGTASSTRLRALREEHGLTQQEVAEQLGKLAFLRMKRHVGVNADMVAKWERGVKAPSKLYRELLGLLFGVSAGELAVVRPTASPRETITPVEEPLLATLGDAAALLDQLGPAGSILQPRMFDAWRDEVMRRRVLLKLVGLAPTIGLAGSDPPVRTTQPTPEVVLGLDELAGKYQALYHSTAPAVLMTPVVAHLQTVRDVLRNNVAPALRRKLLVNRARAATLAGRLAFFDLHDPMSARAYYNLALEAAREAGDHLQAAAALDTPHSSPPPTAAMRPPSTICAGPPYHVERQPHGPVSSWLAAIESEMHTNAGATARPRWLPSTVPALPSTRPGLHSNLPWFDYYDSPRLDGFAGYAELRARRFDESRATLTNALDRLPRQAVKQRAVFLCDLATVQLHDGEVDEACRVAVQAADHLHRAGYATASGQAARVPRSIRSPGPPAARFGRWTISSPPWPKQEDNAAMPIRAVWFDVGEALDRRNPRVRHLGRLAGRAQAHLLRGVRRRHRPRTGLPRGVPALPSRLRPGQANARPGWTPASASTSTATTSTPTSAPASNSSRTPGTSSASPGTRPSAPDASSASSTCPADFIATSDDWGVAKPDPSRSSASSSAVSGHQPEEIAYVGDRLDNDIAPAVEAGLRTVWIRRGPWGMLLEPGSASPTGTVTTRVDWQIRSLDELPALLERQTANNE